MDPVMYYFYAINNDHLFIQCSVSQIVIHIVTRLEIHAQFALACVAQIKQQSMIGSSTVL